MTDAAESIPSDTYPHHENGKKLWNAVAEGCHLCTMLWDHMCDNARLGVRNGYVNGWTHDQSMVGQILYTLAANSGGFTKRYIILFIYGPGPDEPPLNGLTVAIYATPELGM